MKKKVDFNNIEVETLNGEKKVFKIAEELGNAIFAKTQDLGELELAREIYKNGEVEVTEQQAQMLNDYIKKVFLAFIQVSICPILEGLFVEEVETIN